MYSLEGHLEPSQDSVSNQLYVLGQVTFPLQAHYSSSVELGGWTRIISTVCPSLPKCSVFLTEMNLGLTGQAHFGDLLRRWMFGAIAIVKIEQASEL